MGVAAGCATSESTTSVAAAKAAPQQQAAQSATTADADKDKEICKREQVTGSNFTKRICMTQEEWEMVRQRTEQAMEDINKTRRSQSGCSGNNCR
jgi:NAD dependent epimerase/dehydratase family enzyme